MSEHTHAADIPPGQEPTHHEIPIKTFALVFFALFVLMVLTIFAAEYGSEHGWNVVAMNLIAMGIACTKATLVVLYFMGAKFTTQLAKIYAAAGFVWVLLLCITFCDYATRHDEPAPGWIKGQPHSFATDITVPEVGKEAPRQYFGAN